MSLSLYKSLGYLLMLNVGFKFNHIISGKVEKKQITLRERDMSGKGQHRSNIKDPIIHCSIIQYRKSKMRWSVKAKLFSVKYCKFHEKLENALKSDIQ